MRIHVVLGSCHQRHPRGGQRLRFGVSAFLLKSQPAGGSRSGVSTLSWGARIFSGCCVNGDNYVTDVFAGTWELKGLRQVPKLAQLMSDLSLNEWWGVYSNSVKNTGSKLTLGVATAYRSSGRTLHMIPEMHQRVNKSVFVRRALRIIPVIISTAPFAFQGHLALPGIVRVITRECRMYPLHQGVACAAVSQPRLWQQGGRTLFSDFAKEKVERSRMIERTVIRQCS